MNNYKIKIACTSFNELCYNNEKISIKNYNQLNFEHLINNNDYIKEALILYKNLNGTTFVTKSLEFLCKCDYELSEVDFQNFIKNLKNIGFSSYYDTTIHLIQNDKPNKYIFTYNFESLTKKKIKKLKMKPNNSTYTTQILYKK